MNEYKKNILNAANNLTNSELESLIIDLTDLKAKKNARYNDKWLIAHLAVVKNDKELQKIREDLVGITLEYEQFERVHKAMKAAQKRLIKSND